MTVDTIRRGVTLVTTVHFCKFKDEVHNVGTLKHLNKLKTTLKKTKMLHIVPLILEE